MEERSTGTFVVLSSSRIGLLVKAVVVLSEVCTSIWVRSSGEVSGAMTSGNTTREAEGPYTTGSLGR